MATKKETILFPKEDREAIEKLRRIVHPSPEEINLIWILFKRYTGSPISSYTTNCNSCPTSIVNIYWQLLEWFTKNESLFEQ